MDEQTDTHDLFEPIVTASPSKDVRVQAITQAPSASSRDIMTSGNDFQMIRCIVASLENTVMDRGKHQGLTFAQAYEKDPSYADFLGRCLRQDAVSDGRKPYRLSEIFKIYAAYSVLRSIVEGKKK